MAQNAEVFAAYKVNTEILEVSLGTLDEDGFAKLSHQSFVIYLAELVQDSRIGWHTCAV